MSLRSVIVASRLRTEVGRCVMWVTLRRAPEMRAQSSQAVRGTLRAMPKRRLDTLLAERGLFETRSRAAAAVMAGDVRVGDGGRRRKPGELVADDARAGGRRARRRSSRAAGSSWPTRSTPSGSTRPGGAALDVGASTGGFTDCLLQRGADGRDRARRGLRRAALDAAQRPARDRDRARNARSLRAGELPWRARPDRRRRLVHLADQGAAGRCSAARRRASTASRWSSRSSRSGASASARAAWCATADDRRAALVGGRRARARRARRRGARLRLVGAARAGRQPRELRLAGRGRARGRASRTSRRRRRRAEP